MTNRLSLLTRPILIGAFALLAGGFTAVAQPPAAEPAKTAPAEGSKSYQAELLETRADSKRVTFRVRQDGSMRVYNMMLADGAKVMTAGQPVGIATMPAGSNVTIQTAMVGGLEQITMIGSGQAAPAGDAKMAGKANGQKMAGKGKMDMTDMGEPTGGKVAMAFPTGDAASSVLKVETAAPDQVRVGEKYDYAITVTNLSKTITLENVVVSQSASSKLDVMASGQAAEGQVAPANGEDGSDLTWKVASLKPGESKKLSAPAVAHEEGVIGSCFRASYDAAMCVRITAVKPSIALTKTAPEVVRLCEDFTFKYTVKNTGTVAVKNVVVADTLPEGLVTAENKKDVSFSLPELAAGEAKEFTTPVIAAGRGTFSSKANAKTEGGLNVESRTTTTKVQEAALEVTIDGPASAFVSETMTYVATIKNVGDAPAPGTTLDINLDTTNANFVNASQIEGVEAKGEVKPTDGKLSYAVGTLNPGETRKASFVLSGTKQGAVNAVAIGRFVCARAKDTESALAMAKSAVKTELKTIPALRLSLVDQSDLIKVGTEVVYTLQVINQGTGPDTNLTLKLTLPAELEYVSSEGSTVAKAEGQVVAFGNVETLEPGKTVTWNIKCKAKSAADVRTTAELNSAYLKAPVTTTEPTRLIK